MSEISQEAEAFFAWRDALRKKHRVMTSAEYAAWCRGGDALSHPSNSNAFPGGLTILVGLKCSYLGSVVDEAPVIGRRVG